MISKLSLAAFSDELRHIQVADADTPPDYLETRAAVMAKLGGIIGRSLVGGAQKVLGSRAGKFISRHAAPLEHGADLAGLGVLGIAPASELRHSKDPHERFKAKAELTGLGMLSAAPAIHVGRHLLGRH